MLLFYQVATRLSLKTCYQVVELQDDNKLLEQLGPGIFGPSKQKIRHTSENESA